jgi:uncharacterized protein YecT (DUF1311 family)
MKNALNIFALLTCLTGFSQTQTEMNQSAEIACKKADKLLNNTYQNILIEFESDSIFIENFKESHKIWMTFRDSELKVKYPERPEGYYGSSLSMCKSIFLEKLTNERISSLKAFLNKSGEENICD